MAGHPLAGRPAQDITGKFRVDSRSDDDFMGFIFGFQNDKQFYIFDWKQNRRGFVGGIAERGMSIRRFDAGDREFTEPDFWWTDRNRENMTVLSPPNGIRWEDFQDYDITLDLTPGRIVVEVREEGTLLDRLKVEDENFTGGRFGFYNYSQDSVIYQGFAQEALNNTYFYDSEVIDPEGGAVIYSLAQVPPGATVNPNNGTVFLPIGIDYNLTGASRLAADLLYTQSLAMVKGAFAARLAPLWPGYSTSAPNR